jgi:hypothetical protein
MIINKNKKCYGCEHYSLGGPRKCRAIIQKHYQAFKQVCPCRDCNQKETCAIKSAYTFKESFLNTSLFKNVYPCYTYLFASREFIESIPDYYENTSYLDPKHNESYIIIKRGITKRLFKELHL